MARRGPRGLVHIAILLLGLPAALAADPPLQPFSHHQGWEDNGPAMELWAKNGDAVERANGPTDEQAFEGKRSFKLDVELKGGSYHYWGIPLRVPAVGRLKLTARVLVAAGTTCRVGFGTNMIFPPTHHSGCSPFVSWDKPTDGWQLAETDLIDAGKSMAGMVLPQYTGNATGDEVVPILDRYGLFVLGEPGQRAVVYVDDVRIEGEVPAQADADRLAQERFAAARERLKPRLEGWRQAVAAAEERLAGLAAVPADLADKVDAVRQTVGRVRATLAQMEQQGYGDTSQFQQVDGSVALLRYGPDNVKALTDARAAGRPFVLYASTAIRNEQPVLGTFPIPAEPGGALKLSACRGEYESGSVVVYPLRATKRVTVSVSDLTGPAGTIPAAAVDVRVVKCWYQAGRGIGDLHSKRLVPELLLKDDALVRVDREAQANYLRHTSPDGGTAWRLCSGPTSADLEDVRPVDAEELQPVDLAPEELKQYWLTLRVPDDAKPGDYQGTVTVRSAEGEAQVPLALGVQPFELLPPRLIYSVYYRATLAADGQPHIDSELRSEEQYRAEIADMKAHGVLYPSNYQGWDEQRLPRILEIRRELGMPGGPFFTLGQGTGSRGDPASLTALKQSVGKWRELCGRFGYDQVYFYGADEATGDALVAQKAAWGAVQEAGGKTFVACYYKTFEAMGKLLNVAVLAGRPDPAEADKWHGVDSLAFCYANPQVGPEEPETFRRNFGLLLWCKHFDGAMDYAYQHGFHHVWNDFDDPTYRDHVFTYPTVHGIVGTVQWEGFREGVDDVRYLTTLEHLCETTPVGNALPAQAKAWLDGLDPDAADLDAVRAKAAEWIMRIGG
ncbi:MAG: hypothetical protein HYU66_22500 [Armatimonadetes bacterium]|nr:hypothetical protein [Armatimonadota bacterium]